VQRVNKFTGKERDSKSGLDNFEARYFGSSLGRFMTPDPDQVITCATRRCGTGTVTSATIP